jgi:hypothetical protein
MFSILILTEDSSKHAHQTLERLLISTFAMIESGYQPRRLVFQEQSTLGQARQAVIANQWESQKAKDIKPKRELRRLIANRLLEGPGVVMFHFDGDQPWANRAACTRFGRFQQEIVGPVREIIEGRHPGAAEEALQRLILVTPFYSMEAWLYQNADKLQRILTETYQGQDLPLAHSWQADDSLLDELLRPKECICARDRHNRELASGFPADKVYNVGKSYSETVERLLSCDSLTAALKKTWQEP